MGFDVFALDAANAADRANRAASANMDANVLIAQMVSMNKQAIDEMRNWQTVRFNDVIASLDRRADQIDKLNDEIADLKGQVAGLQKRLYEEQEKNKGIAR